MAAVVAARVLTALLRARLVPRALPNMRALRLLRRQRREKGRTRQLLRVRVGRKAEERCGGLKGRVRRHRLRQAKRWRPLLWRRARSRKFVCLCLRVCVS